MKEKRHSNVPNPVFNNIKTCLLLMTFFLGSLSFIFAQNINANENATVDGGEISTTDNTEVCVGDGVSDFIDVQLSGASGRVKQWIITDDQNNILSLPENPPFDFDGAPPGNCRIWHLSYNGIKPLVDPSGQGKFTLNLADIRGKYDLSNYIEVVRIQQPKGGDISLADGSTEIEICAGDGVSDIFEVTLEGAEGPNMLWVITDTDANILGTSNESSFDLEEAGGGTCLIWHLSYAENVSLAGVTNTGDLVGCFDLSNPIMVIRNGVNAGDIEIVGGATEIEICAGDGNSDAFDVNIIGDTEGSNFAWLITSDALDILDIVDPSNATFDLEGAGSGTCLIWRIAYEDGLQGAIVGENAADLSGCFSLSNPITVTRNGVNGGVISGGQENTFNFTVGDGVADNIAADAITLVGSVGANSKWLVTNEAGTIILGVADNYTGPNFEGAGAGTCLLWHLSYEDGLNGLFPAEGVDYLVSGLSGCFALSNPIKVVRTLNVVASKMSIFPNPAKNTVNVKFSSSVTKSANIKVYTLQNVQIFNKDYNLNDGIASFDVSDYKNGIYFIKITDIVTGKAFVKRLVVN